MFLCASLSAFADQKVIISEFLADNTNGLKDRDGDVSDWIELYNATDSSVDLGGWHLTDDAADLKKWTFPSTNLPPGGFLLVFASAKDRAVAGQELHTNFQLDPAGEYLGLIRPDGSTVEFDFSPTYPPQLPDVSYGVIPIVNTNTFVTVGTPMRWIVPKTQTDLAATWMNQTFDDSGWKSGFVPAGFDAGQIDGVGILRTNLARGKTATQSSTKSLQTAKLAVDGNTNSFSQTAAGAALPATWEVNLGTNAWIEEIIVYNRNDGCCGSRLRDITISVLSLDGKTTIIASSPLNPDNILGDRTTNGPAFLSLNLTQLLGTAVYGGRVRVSRTPDPDLSGSGGKGTADEADTLSLSEVVVNGSLAPISYRGFAQTDLQSDMLGVNASAFLRVPFLVVSDSLPTFDVFNLAMRYDDGFVAYLNGVPIANANAPAVTTWNSSASAEHADPAAIQPVTFDITAHANLLQDGINVLAIQGLNQSASNDDFLQAPELFGRTGGTTPGQYYTTPSPGIGNSAGTAGVVGDTKFSVDRGFYDAPISVEITTTTEGAEIRYTTNGSEPSAVNGTLYTGPISIDRTTVLRAVATKPGFTPSNVDTHTYVFLSQVLNQSTKTATNLGFPKAWAGTPADYAMDPRITTNAANSGQMIASLRSLPSVFFSTSISNLFDSSKGIYANPSAHGLDWEKAASMEYVNTNGNSEFQINCGIRIQGGYFRDPGVTRKHSLRVLFKSNYGPGRLHHDLFKSDDAVAQFDTLVLRAGANDGYAWADAKDTEQFTRNHFGTELERTMGHPNPHAVFVHVYLNGLYWGLYEMCERPNEDFSAAYYGGNSLDWDSNNAGDIKNGDLAAFNAFTALTPKAKTLADYEKLQGNNADGSRNPNYPVYLDKFNYIDYMIVNIWGGNWDWPNKNFWFGNLRTTNSTGFKFYMWDFENTMGNNLDRSPINMVSPRAGTEDSWVGQPHFYLKSLAEYKMDFADRVQKYFFNGGILTPNALIKRYRNLVDGVELSILSETARWGDDNLTPPQDIDDWRRERDWILGSYLPQRSDVVMKQFRSAGLYPSLGAPQLSQFGGTVQPGLLLELTHTNAAGQIYFTLNGTDPRVLGGGLSPSAQLYTVPISIPGNALLKTRVRNTTNWSALVEVPFTSAEYFRNLVASEIMYNPLGDATHSGDDFEFLELRNNGSETLDLTGLSFTAGITYTFKAGSQLAAGGTFVLGRNASALQTRYPGLKVDDVYSGTLANGGETLTLTHNLLGTVFSFAYGTKPPWPIAADGLGFSLVRRDPTDGTDPAEASSWRASSASGGSPGASDPAVAIAPIVINEIMSNNGLNGDFVELYNPTTTNVSVAGWYLTDDGAIPRKYRIPDGTLILPNNYIVINEAQFKTVNSTNGFGLDSGGDQVYLYSASANGGLTGYSHGFRFGAASLGVSFGRVVLSTGAEDLAPQLKPTPGQANSGAATSPVVISEIHYNPPPGGHQFVEIHNVSSVAQKLYDTAHPTNTWRISGLNFDFPKNTVLDPGQFALIVDITPSAFRSEFGIPASTQIFGPFTGTLQNSGELLELQRPEWLSATATKTDYVSVDSVRYNDHSPWPPAADGAGPSLQRVHEDGLANDPVNWVAAVPSPGSAWAGGVRPAIAGQPDNAVALIRGTTRFEVIAAATEVPVQYQWRLNGNALPGATASTLVLTNLQLSQGGRYSAVVFTTGGSVVSSNAILTVLEPATITSHPQNTVGLLGSNVTFSVAAISSSPLRYQWRFNGKDIPNATSATLTLKGLTYDNAGLYSCLVTDSVGPIESNSATLAVVVKPILTQAPVSIEVPAGGTAVFSASAEGSLPLTFRWRKSSTVLTNMTVFQNTAFFVISNVQTINAAKYSVTVTNLGGAALTSPDVILTVLPDGDLDGIPDAWETQFHFDPRSKVDASQDADGDSMSNLAEYIAGTDPHDATSYLKLDSIQTNADGIALDFNAVASRTYSLQFRTTLDSDSWSVLASIPARATNHIEHITTPAAVGTNYYYRLVTPAIQLK